MDMYQITYENGVTQKKVLIPHEQYLIYKSIEDEDEKELFLKGITKGEEWFTDMSPLYEAIQSGVLNCNGIYKCTIKPLNPR